MRWEGGLAGERFIGKEEEFVSHLLRDEEPAEFKSEMLPSEQTSLWLLLNYNLNLSYKNQ